jgi:CHAT domain-containing protein
MRGFLAAALLLVAGTAAAQESSQALIERAEQWERAGQPGKQIEDLKRAVEVNFDRRERLRALRLLVNAHLNSGSLLAALDANRQASEVARQVGPGATMQPLQQAANIHARLGDVARAREAVAEMDALMGRLRRGPGWEAFGHAWTSFLERGRGRLFEVQGQFAEAEQAAATALAAAERQLQVRVAGAASAAEREEIAAQTGWIEGLSRELAQFQLVQGKLNDAELVARRGLQLALARAGERSPSAARSRMNLGNVLFERGRYAEAEKEARASLAASAALGFGGESQPVFGARGLLGAALAMQERWEDAVAVYTERVEAIGRADPELRKQVRIGSIAWAMALIQTGRLDRAVGLLQTMLRRTAERQGEDSFGAAMSRGVLAVALHRKGDTARALEEFRRAVPVLIRGAFQDQKDNRDGPARVARLVYVLEGYLRALEGEPGHEAEMFRIADFARGGKVQRSLALGAARAAVRDPALAGLVAARERLESRVVTLSGTLGNLVGAPEEKRLDQVIAGLRRDLDAARKELAALNTRIEGEHPDFATLAAPRAVTLAEAQAALRPGEALISIYVAADRTYVWAVPQRGAPAMAVRPLGAAQVAAWVGTLRKALDIGDAPLERIPAFDVATAHRLYRELLEPVRAGWQDARAWVVIPHRALGQLPFSLLVTDENLEKNESMPFARYRSVRWLIDEVAIAQLPAAASLVTLARLPAPREGRRPFAGFGDPVFSGSKDTPRGFTRSAVAFRAGEAPPPGGSLAPSFTRLPPLPDTREEIREIAALLRADDKDVFLGLSANEQRVKSADLGAHRVIAFATHGLVPGDLEGLSQPALALSNPALAGVEGDGVLAMDEILGLRLDADWVVLSACNTAAAGEAGEEAVSGLGRAFFYAGARALLVSNWPVETVSARLLTTEVFKRPSLPRAEALRLAMRHVMREQHGRDRDGKPLFSYAHPLFWAPFSLVGHGG